MEAYSAGNSFIQVIVLNNSLTLTERKAVRMAVDLLRAELGED